MNKPENLSLFPQTRQAIRAELTGADACTALGITARGTSPVLALCRGLVKAAVNPGRPLHVYRNDTLALRVSSIGEAAGLEINSKGTAFIKRRTTVRTAPSVTPLGQAGVRPIRAAMAGAVP